MRIVNFIGGCLLAAGVAWLVMIALPVIIGEAIR